MKKLSRNKLKSVFFPHSIIILGLALISLLFYFPLLSGKTMIQSDIIQYEGMSRQLKNYRVDTGKETYWVDNAFGGMPTYQLGAKYPADFLSPVYSFFRILPRPAHILFLYFLGAYSLLLILKKRWYIALFGALAFGFSTYLLIILQVGHNTKALAVSFFPFVFGGLVLLFQKRLLWGFLLLTIALGMQIRANHYQMTYYLLLLMSVFIIVFAIQSIKDKKIRSFIRPFFLLLISGVLAVGFNSTPILATLEYSDFSTRGESELKLNSDGSPKEQSSGLDYNYITEYSYGIFESLNLIAPRIQGGGSSENLGKKHGVYDFLRGRGVGPEQATQFSKNTPTYWGSQPILEAPAYIGISVFFFGFLALFFVKGRLINTLGIGILFSLLLSWGKNFAPLTQFFIDYIPLYNKFRAVSSIQIILEFCFPILAAYGVQWAFEAKDKFELKKFIKAAILPIMLLGALYLFHGVLNFSGPNDEYFQEIYGLELVAQIKVARISIFKADVLRGIIFCTVLTGIILAFKYQKLKRNAALIAVILILLIDLLGISNRYVSRDKFVSPRLASVPFQISVADRAIQKDTSRYRVFEPRLGLTGSRTAYFHNTIGGYHGAKPRRLEELFDYYNSNQIPSILDILNVKYVLFENKETGNLEPLLNSNALGPVWTVNNLKEFSSADAILDEVKVNDFKKNALIISNMIPNGIPRHYSTDSLSSIRLIKSYPNSLTYSVKNTKEQFAVFSEMYYPKGWTAKVDGKTSTIYNVNYVLRGVLIPAGTSEIVFSFSPLLVKYGTILRWITLFLFLGIISIIGYFEFREVNKY
jgi:hypothetical protein